MGNQPEKTRKNGHRGPRRRLPRGGAEALPPLSIFLRDKRVEQGWTRAETARRLELSPTTLGKIERGNLGTSGKTLDRILSYFGYRLGAVREDKKEPPSSLGDEPTESSKEASADDRPDRDERGYAKW